MLKVIEKPAAREASEELLPLDEIAREGARRMLIEALRRRPTITSSAIVASATSTDARWWCATVGPKGASLPWERGR